MIGKSLYPSARYAIPGLKSREPACRGNGLSRFMGNHKSRGDACPRRWSGTTPKKKTGIRTITLNPLVRTSLTANDVEVDALAMFNGERGYVRQAMLRSAGIVIVRSPGVKHLMILMNMQSDIIKES